MYRFSLQQSARTRKCEWSHTQNTQLLYRYGCIPIRILLSIGETNVRPPIAMLRKPKDLEVKRELP
eukprot:SAG22_NODE_4157_length_1365_cov_1.327014_3_plen_65_part_01